MRTDKVNSFYKKQFGLEFDQKNVNKLVKAVIINFGDERGDIVVENDNFGTRRKYADFTEGKKKAGLNPMQIVFLDWEEAHLSHGRYIGKDDLVHEF